MKIFLLKKGLIARGRIEIHNKEIYSFSVKIKDEYKKYLLK